jgi:hypothetical protein
MEFGSFYAFRWNELLASSDQWNGNVRMTIVDGGNDPVNPTDVTTLSPWFIPSATNYFGYFPAVCSFAANYTLSKNGGVPLGFIASSVGGTFIEQWTASDSDVCHYQPDYLSSLYNGRIAPLKGWKFAGIVWYQGEFNALKAFRYQCQLRNLISSWRKLFQNNQLPWINVQVSSWNSTTQDFNYVSLIRSVQGNIQDVPNTAVVATFDLGDPDSPFLPIHPRNKSEVGYRVSQNILKMVYGQQVTFAGPIFKNWTSTLTTTNFLFFSTTQALIQIQLEDSQGLSLQLRSPSPCPFGTPICGNIFELKLSTGWVVVTSPIQLYGNTINFTLTVPTGSTVLGFRYAQGQYAPSILYNSAGFPALPYSSVPEFQAPLSNGEYQFLFYVNNAYKLFPSTNGAALQANSAYSPWIVLSTPDGAYTVKDPASGKYLTLSNGNCSAGMSIGLSTLVQGSDSQKWYIASNGFMNTPTYEISSKRCNLLNWDNLLNTNPITAGGDAYSYSQFWAITGTPY